MTERTDRLQWHPILGANEGPPGVWTLIDTFGRQYGAVRIVRQGERVRYVGGRIVEGKVQRIDPGWTKLLDAIAAVHRAHVASMSVQTPPDRIGRPPPAAAGRP